VSPLTVSSREGRVADDQSDLLGRQRLAGDLQGLAKGSGTNSNSCGA
jgi:hypothetical protein